MKAAIRAVILGATFLAGACHAGESLNLWTVHDLGTSGNTNFNHDFYGICYDHAVFVTVGDQTILASQDGSDWSAVFHGQNGFFRGIGSGNGEFVAVGETSRFVTSSNGVNWRIGPLDSTVDHFRTVVYGNDGFLALGFYRPSSQASTDAGSGAVAASSDGIHFSESTSPSFPIFASVVFKSGLFVAVGRNLFAGTISNSTNGYNWSTIELEPNIFALSSITSGNGRFVTVGYPGVIVTSVDGRNWSPVNSGTTVPLTCVAYGNGVFVTVGWDGTILTSLDGAHWSRRDSGTSKRLNGVAYGNGHFVAVGDQGTIVVSQPIVRLTPKAVSTDGDMHFNLTGPSGQNCVIQVSLTLTNWMNLTSVVLTNETGEFSDSSPTPSGQHFYRTIAP